MKLEILLYTPKIEDMLYNNLFYNLKRITNKTYLFMDKTSQF